MIPAAPLRLIYMGTPDFAVPPLQAILQAGHKVVAVYTQPPRPAGRGHKMQISPVQAVAEQAGIPIFHPINFKAQADRDVFAGHAADLAVVAAYGLILPKAVLQAPRLGCWNIHASLLPRWRGASPIQHAIWKGDTVTGVTLMQMEAGLDTGPMLDVRRVDITPTTTASDLHNTLSQAGADMLVRAIASPFSFKPHIQDDALSSYAPLLTKDDGRINWAESAEAIDRHIRALNPWPGTYTHVNGHRVKILEAHGLRQNPHAPAGTVLNREGDMACGSGILRVTKLQPDGGKPMAFGAAINGHYIQPGQVCA